MEIAMEFATFCNICFNKNDLRKIEQTEDLTRILMLFIENKILIKEHEIYLCLNCCEKLESYDKFKEMCLRNFIDFRIEYSEFKKKLEIINDPNMEKKLRSFIETKVNGVNDTINMDVSEDLLKTPYGISVPESKNNLTEKEDEGNFPDYNLQGVSCKIEKIEYEDIKEYKFHTELDLESNRNDFELPVPIEHIKLESCLEEKESNPSDSSDENDFIKQSTSTGLYKTDESCDSVTNSTQNEDQTPVNTSNETEQSTTKKFSYLDCRICNKTYSSVSSLNRHLRIHAGEKPYTCTICNKSFSSSSTLKSHAPVHIGEKQYSCDICNKTFATESYLESHKWVHTEERRHICNICNKGFCLSKRLKKHMLIHSNDKPYKCLICDKNFRILSELNRHERVHTGEKPYSCSKCDKTFTYSGQLKTHELVHTGEHPYTCKQCQKSFRDQAHLKLHERIHTGEKPYECPDCNKRFTSATTYRAHKLIHTGEKPYSCRVCNKSFRKSSNMREHEHTHTGAKPFSCDTCNKNFTWRNVLRLHKKKCVPSVVENKMKQEET